MTTKACRALMAAAAVLMAAATGLGAWASHGLDTALDASALAAFETAVAYQFVHSLGVFGIAVYGERQQSAKLLGLAAVALLAGTVLFCGGVYSSSLDGPAWIASLAPAGGISLIAGWLGVAFAVIRTPRPG